MEERNNHIDGLLRVKLKGHRQEPPGMVWEGIREGLAADRKKRFLLYARRIAAGIAFLAAIGTGYYYLERHGSEPFSGKQTAVSRTSRKPGNLESAPAGSKPDRENTNPVSAEQTPATDHQPPPKVTEQAQKATGKSGTLPETGPVKDQALTAGGHTTRRPGKMEETESLSENYGKKLPEGAFMHSLAEGLIAHTGDTIGTPGPRLVASWDMLAMKEAESSGTNEKKERLSLSASFSPVYSYRTLSVDNTSVRDYYNNSENPAVSYSGGVTLGFKASSRLRFQTGLVYARLGIEVGSVEAVSGISPERFDNYSDISQNANYLLMGNSIGEVNTSSGKEVNTHNATKDSKADLGSGPGNSPIGAGTSYQQVDVSLDQWFHFVEVPFMLEYKVVDGKIDLNLLGGLSTNFLLANDVILKDNGERTYFGTTQDVRRINYSGNIGIGIDIDLTKSLLFTFEPQLKYYLNSFNNHNLITSRPYYIGMYTGIRYEF
ncbi:MAG TPA: outer membrane beta-barrel protein [Bacteroidales bacterium]|nr:outer membrane beta-barrel protein [Bacteroidales bacterium]